jgi:hypothetical protein
MRGERASGPPTLVRRDIAGAPWFVLRGDRIMYRIHPEPTPLWSVTLDPTRERVAVPPSPFLEFRGQLVNGSRFDWTPDGAEFTYVRQSSRGGRPAVEIVRLPASGRGDERTIRLDGIGYLNGRMPFGEDAILVRGQRPERPGYGELLRVDLSSGEVTPIEDPNLETLRQGDFPGYRAFSEDLSVLYLTREHAEATEVVARTVRDGSERVVHRVERGASKRRSRLNLEGPALSPDGSLLAFVVYSEDSEDRPARPSDAWSSELRVVSVQGGPARTVHTGWIGGASLNWTSDSRALVFRDLISPGAAGGQVWKVAADGSSKTLLLSMPSGLGGLRLSPDDRRIVFGGPIERRVEELWVLENLPETRPTAASTSSR